MMCLFTKKMITFFLFMTLSVLPATRAKSLSSQGQSAKKTEHVVLFIIDGLSYKTWEKVDLPVLDSLIETGVLVEKNDLPPSEHPTEGPYA